MTCMNHLALLVTSCSKHPEPLMYELSPHIPWNEADVAEIQQQQNEIGVNPSDSKSIKKAPMIIPNLLSITTPWHSPTFPPTS